MNYKDRVFIVTREIHLSSNNTWSINAPMEVFSSQELAMENMESEIGGESYIEASYPILTPKEFPIHVIKYKSRFTGHRLKVTMTTRPVYNKSFKYI